MKRQYRVPLIVVGLVCVIVACQRIYTNYNDGLYVYGRGVMLVKSCQRTGDTYLCSGSFQQNGGMVVVVDVSVKTGNFFSAGDTINDVFPHYTYGGNETTEKTFQTGAERRSIGNNAPFMIMGLIGVSLVCSPLLRRHKQRPQTLDKRD
jgi:hypothetical protein